MLLQEVDSRPLLEQLASSILTPQVSWLLSDSAFVYASVERHYGMYAELLSRSWMMIRDTMLARSLILWGIVDMHSSHPRFRSVCSHLPVPNIYI